MYDLHTTLFSGEIGASVVGILGLLLLVLSITGAFLWSGWRQLVAGWKIRWQAPKPIIYYDLHKVVGIVSVTFLIFIASTGIALTFWSPFHQLTYWLT